MNSTSPRVLLVEDEPVLLVALQTILGARGAEVRTASSGTAALAEVEKSDPIQLFVLDLTLPDMSGTEVAERIRLSPPHASSPILILSGDNRRGEEAARELTARFPARTEYLDKSASPDVLLRKVMELAGA